jgi:hypothetical protein
VAVAFAGFAGLASLLGERAQASRRAFEIFDRIAMIGFGVLAAGFALLPRILLALGLAEPVAWRASALAMAISLIVWSGYGVARRRRLAAAVGASPREAADRLPWAGFAVNGTLALLFALLPAARVPGVYVAALFLLLIFSALYFLRLLIPRTG